MFTSTAMGQQEGSFFEHSGERKELEEKGKIRRWKFMDAHKINKEHIDLRIFQLKVQCNTVALETSAASTPIFANYNQWKSLALGHPFSWTVLYPSKRK